MQPEDRMQEAVRLNEHVLPLKKWGFKESARYFYNNLYPTLIYDSNKCRVYIYHDTVGRKHEYGTTIYYGSLGVPNSADLLIRDQDDKNPRLLWHSPRLLLCFIDGLSPQNARQEKEPRRIRELRQSETIQKIKYLPERRLAEEKAIWEMYGQRLFGLFDAKNIKLWKEYLAFRKAYWQVLFDGE